MRIVLASLFTILLIGCMSDAYGAGTSGNYVAKHASYRRDAVSEYDRNRARINDNVVTIFQAIAMGICSG